MWGSQSGSDYRTGKASKYHLAQAGLGNFYSAERHLAIVPVVSTASLAAEAGVVGDNLRNIENVSIAKSVGDKIVNV